MAIPPLCLVTLRDLDLFQALDHGPLTVRQLLKLSAAFAYPFTTERRVQERLQRLCAARRVRRWPYSTAGRGALSYYTLSPLGYRLLHGFEAQPSGRGRFGPVGVARQGHTQALAEVNVHLFVAAHEAQVPVENFRRENALRLQLGEESLYPDGAFELAPQAASRFSFFVEMDNRTETVGVGSTHDSWGRKVQFYEKYQDAQGDRFRVLLFTTGGPERLRHMLGCAEKLARNPKRSLVYGIRVADFLDTSHALQTPCFSNHVGNPVALLPSPQTRLRSSGQAEELLVASAACLRPLPRV